jgi:hypothetical protein
VLKAKQSTLPTWSSFTTILTRSRCQKMESTKTDQRNVIARTRPQYMPRPITENGRQDKYPSSRLVGPVSASAVNAVMGPPPPEDKKVGRSMGTLATRQTRSARNGHAVAREQSALESWECGQLRTQTDVVQAHTCQDSHIAVRPRLWTTVLL